MTDKPQAPALPYEKYLINGLKQLARIADALEVMALAAAPKSPNYLRTLDEFAGFDWEAIGAEVLAIDEFGVGQVKWGGYIWTRRAPENKYTDAVWFSRPDGKNEEGSNRYVRLITFKNPTQAEPVSRKVERAINQPARPAAEPEPAATTTPAKYDPTKDARLKTLKHPSEALELEGVVTSVTLYWTLAKVFGLDKQVATDLLRELKQAGAAIQALDKVVAEF